MFDLFDLSELVAIFALLAFFWGVAWMLRREAMRISKRITPVEPPSISTDANFVSADAELKTLRDEISEMQRMLRRNEEYQMRNDERIRDLIISVGRIEGHLFGIEPFVLRDISRRDSRPEA